MNYKTEKNEARTERKSTEEEEIRKGDNALTSPCLSTERDFKKGNPRKKSFECPVCLASFNSKRRLKMHVDAVHTNSGVDFLCDQCEYSSKHQSNLNQHLKSKHEGRMFSCIYCDAKSNFKQYIQKHIKSVHGGRIVFFCSHCEYHSSNKVYYQGHKSQHYQHEKPSRSRMPSKFLNPNLYSNVSNPLTTVKNQFGCDKCHFSTGIKRYLRLHVERVHEAVGQQYQCHLCAYSCKTQHRMDHHTSLQHTDQAPRPALLPLFTPASQLPQHTFFLKPGLIKPQLYVGGFLMKMNKLWVNEEGQACSYFYCPYKDSKVSKVKCKVSAKALENQKNPNLVNFLKAQRLLRNEKAVKSEEGFSNVLLTGEDVGFQLVSLRGVHKESCGRMSSFEECLDARRPTMKINRMRRCTKCDFIAGSIAEFENHLKDVHSDVIQSCTQCAFKTKFTRSLTRHVGRNHGHEGSIDMKCPHCTFVTRSSEVLKKHKQRQHGLFLLECDICGAKFKQTTHLKIHQEGQHFGIRFKCSYPLCTYESAQKGHRNIHEKSKHEGRTFECDVCGVTYSHQFDVKKHKLVQHINQDENAEKLKCEACSFFTTSGAKKLQGHIRSRHGRKNRKQVPVKCELCCASLSSKKHKQSCNRESGVVNKNAVKDVTLKVSKVKKTKQKKIKKPQKPKRKSILGTTRQRQKIRRLAASLVEEERLKRVENKLETVLHNQYVHNIIKSETPESSLPLKNLKSVDHDNLPEDVGLMKDQDEFDSKDLIYPALLELHHYSQAGDRGSFLSSARSAFVTDIAVQTPAQILSDPV